MDLLDDKMKVELENMERNGSPSSLPDEKDNVKLDIKPGINKNGDSLMETNQKDDIKDLKIAETGLTDVASEHTGDVSSRIKSDDSDNSDSCKKRPASPSDNSTDAKKTRLDTVIGRLGSQIGIEPSDVVGTDAVLSHADEDSNQSDKSVSSTESKSEDRMSKITKEVMKISSNIYLFVYCHLYSTFSIVQCSNALYRL